MFNPKTIFLLHIAPFRSLVLPIKNILSLPWNNNFANLCEWVKRCVSVWKIKKKVFWHLIVKLSLKIHHGEMMLSSACWEYKRIWWYFVLWNGEFVMNFVGFICRGVWIVNYVNEFFLNVINCLFVCDQRISIFKLQQLLI